MSNKNLNSGKKAKNNEFYTRYEDIEKELKYYDLKGKSIYCNTDYYRKSNFVKYFIDNFKELGISKITATCFDNGDGAYMYQYDGENATHIEMDGDGDFRSEECVKWLKKCDVVVTNPPFSLFRDFVAQLVKYDKKFLIIGNKNAISYKEIFPLIKDNKLWLGITSPEDFIQPKGDKKKNMKGLTRWFTNIEHSNRIYPLDLYKRYDAEKYPKYDNYNAINVDKVTDIPCDYDGVMGVPITFLDKYCPTQFEIVDAREIGLADKQRTKSTMLVKDADSAINGKPTYARILIRMVH